MGKIKDRTGQKFGRLTALYRLHNYHKQGTYWLCVCDCGNIAEVKSSKLGIGHTKSCGCLQKETVSKLNVKHKKANTRLYKLFIDMKKRCYNQNSKSYKYYGERGVIICDEWLNDFMVFHDWSISHGYKDNFTIDRIDVNGNYEPNNCRWVDMKTQNRNSRHNRNYTINGETHCLSEWCEKLNLKYKNIIQRINKYGWSINEALELKERK